MKVVNLIKNPMPYIIAGKRKVRNTFRQVFYRGDAVNCKICNWKGQYFFEKKCPKCNSLPRTRLVPYALDHFSLMDQSTKILHIAPNVNEYGYVSGRIQNSDNYDRLNITKKPHINLVQDLANTNLKDDQYDLVISWHVFEHIPNDRKAIAEVFRILKQGGSALISVPIYPTGNKTTFEDQDLAYKDFESVHGHHDHCRSCGLDYYLRFEDEGFKTQILEVKELNDVDIDRFGLRTDHVVWCFTK